MASITIPKTDDPDLVRLADLLKLTEQPVMVRLQPESWALESECFPNVQLKIKRDGGNAVLGWQIWKSSNLIEAEFHAVWESPNKKLIDITPKGIELPAIVFIRDDKRPYTGTPVDNIRVNITDNPLVDDLIAIAHAQFIFGTKGERAKQKAFFPTSKETKQFDTLQELRNIVSALLQFKGDRNSPCLCRSGKSFADCHGKNLSQGLQECCQ